MFSAGSPPSILLVEDSEDDAFFFRWAIRKNAIDCHIIHIPDGGEALEYLQGILEGKKPHPDVIFLDLKLPNATGFDILAWVRTRQFDPPLNVVMLSGSELASDLAQAAELGVTAYCIKPISPEALRRHIPAPSLKPGARNVA